MILQQCPEPSLTHLIQPLTYRSGGNYPQQQSFHPQQQQHHQMYSPDYQSGYGTQQHYQQQPQRQQQAYQGMYAGQQQQGAYAHQPQQPPQQQQNPPASSASLIAQFGSMGLGNNVRGQQQQQQAGGSPGPAPSLSPFPQRSGQQQQRGNFYGGGGLSYQPQQQSGYGLQASHSSAAGAGASASGALLGGMGAGSVLAAAGGEQHLTLVDIGDALSVGGGDRLSGGSRSIPSSASQLPAGLLGNLGGGGSASLLGLEQPGASTAGKVVGSGMVGPGAGGSSCIVKMRGLPYHSSPGDILNFFAGYNAVSDTLQIGLDSLGRPSGEAWITFADPGSALLAVRELNRHYLGNRYLELSVC